MEKNVYIVTMYQNVIGVYESFDDASQVALGFINKGRVADVLSRPFITSKITKK